VSPKPDVSSVRVERENKENEENRPAFRARNFGLDLPR